MSSLLGIYLVLGIVTLLGWFSDSRAKEEKTETGTEYRELFFVSIIIVILSLFLGLRTRYNDTISYILHFAQTLPFPETVEIFPLNAISAYPLFRWIEAFVKSYIYDGYHVWLTFVAFLTNASFIIFLRRYSKSLAASVFLYVTLGTYVFGAAGVKQALAMAIVAWSVPQFTKKKYLRASIIVLVATTVHPYALMYFLIPVLVGPVWSKRMAVIIALTGFAGAFFTVFKGILLNLTTLIGKDYDQGRAVDGETVNVWRLMAYVAPPALALGFREKMRADASLVSNTMVNMSIVSAIFIFFALFGTANTFGRLAFYLQIATCIAIPDIIRCHPDKSTKNIAAIIIAIMGIVYLFFALRRFVIIGMHPFAQISIFELFMR